MLPAERVEFVRALNGLAAIKPGAKLTPEALDVWWMAMRDWSLADFLAAAAKLATSVEFMPSPYHFAQLRKAGRMTAGEAWPIAVKACGSAIQGGYVTQNGSCGDALVDRAVRALGGYGVIAMCDTDKLAFLERRFCEHYESIQDASEVRAELPQLLAPEQRERLNGPQSIAALLARDDTETH